MTDGTVGADVSGIRAVGMTHIACSEDGWNGNMRARSNSTPARPYMARFNVLSRLIWPSVWPLLHGSVITFCTAARSCRSVLLQLSFLIGLPICASYLDR